MTEVQSNNMYFDGYAWYAVESTMDPQYKLPTEGIYRQSPIFSLVTKKLF